QAVKGGVEPAGTAGHVDEGALAGQPADAAARRGEGIDLVVGLLLAAGKGQMAVKSPAVIAFEAEQERPHLVVVAAINAAQTDAAGNMRIDRDIGRRVARLEAADTAEAANIETGPVGIGRTHLRRQEISRLASTGRPDQRRQPDPGRHANSAQTRHLFAPTRTPWLIRTRAQ